MITNVPQIDSEGTWVLKPPYDNLLPLNTPLRCVAISNYEQLINMGFDVKKKFYSDAPYNLDDDTYTSHFKEGGKIIALMSSNGKRFQFPLHYLDKFPIGNGVGYASHGILIRLGAIPIDEKLDSLIQQMAELVLLDKGITAHIESSVLSEPKFISNAEHERIEKVRKSKREEKTPAITLVYELKQSNRALAEKLEIVELAYIKSDGEKKELEKQLAECQSKGKG